MSTPTKVFSLNRFSLCAHFAFILCIGTTGFAQAPIRISDPILDIRDNMLHIRYEILNSKNNEYYAVQVEITDQNDEIIDAVTISGDVGDQVVGGSNKEIVWDIGTDSIYLNSDIFVKLYARKLHVSPPGKEFSRLSLILQTAALPGLGLSRIREGKPHWIRGVAGYGCITASIVLNRTAVKSYDQYLEQHTLGDTREYYSRSSSQDTFSEVFAYAALAIWLTDLTWITISSRGMEKTPLYTSSRGLKVGTTFEPFSLTPMLGIRYCF